MNCIVTAGPAYEPIDQVRRLTNFSTGRLGTDLAGYLAQQGHTVTLLKGETATYPLEPKGCTMLPFSTSGDLRSKIDALATSQVEAFFHVAAVSDFACSQVWQRDEQGALQPLQEGKISSRRDRLFLELVAAPKIIGGLRQQFPRAWLVGWKYEVDGDQDSLRAQADRQIRENQTNACVLNGPAYGEGFGWVLPSVPVRHVASAEELIQTLESSLPRD